MKRIRNITIVTLLLLLDIDYHAARTTQKKCFIVEAMEQE